MCRTNGLKKLYERELTMQSKYYAVLDGLLRNFREAEAAEGLNITTADFQRMGKLILADEQLCNGISNARIEATNNKIKLSVRMAYGFRNIDNLISMIMLRCGGLNIGLPGRARRI